MEVKEKGRTKPSQVMDWLPSRLNWQKLWKRKRSYTYKMDEEVGMVLDSRYKGRPYAPETLGGFLLFESLFSVSIFYIS